MTDREFIQLCAEAPFDWRGWPAPAKRRMRKIFSDFDDYAAMAIAFATSDAERLRRAFHLTPKDQVTKP